MANMAGRIIQRTPTPETYQFYGGFATGGYMPASENEKPYTGPSWFSDNMKDVY
jgi:hypothetical protein